MAISFTQIPITLRTPGMFVEVDRSQMGARASIYPTRVVIIGQMTAAGTATPLTPQIVLSPSQAPGRYGRRSQLAHMISAFMASDNTLEVWAVGVQDAGAGVAAVGEVLIGGAATGPGVLPLWAGGTRYRTAVTTGMTAAQIATALAATISADLDAPVTAAVDGETAAQVNITAVNEGAEGNSIDLRTTYYDDDVLPPGVTMTITPMAGGAANPDITPALAALGDAWFTDIVVPWNDAANLTALHTDLDDRFGAMRMQDCHGWRALDDEDDDLVAHGDARNSPYISAPGWYRSPTLPWRVAASYAASCIRALTNDPARPVQTLPVPGVLPPAIPDRFKRPVRDVLLHHGISTLVADAGGSVSVERIITGLREDAFGAPDTSFLNVEQVKAVSYLRFDLRTYFQRKYPRHKLAKDGTRFGAGQPVMTPKLGRAEIISRFEVWEELGLVQDFDRFKAELQVELNAQDEDRMDALVPPKCIRGFRVGAFLLQPR